jgi:hypothetical protein
VKDAAGIGVSSDFLVTSPILIATLGAGILYTLAAGLSRAPRAGVVGAFVALGDKLALADR